MSAPGISSHPEIERFLALVYASIEMQICLARIGNDVQDIAAFASTRGFGFSGDELEAYIAGQLEARLDDQQKQARAAALEGDDNPPVFSDREHHPNIEIRDAAAGPLDRRPVLAGDIVIVSGSAAFTSLIEHLRHALTNAFGEADPPAALTRLDEQNCHARVQEVDKELFEDRAVPLLVAEFVRSLGWSPQEIRFFGPFLRYNLPPVQEGAAGYFSKVPVRFTSRHAAAGGRSALLNGHRDTWFGAPFHQLNVWGPLYPYPRGSGLVLMPALFSRSLRNNTAGFDTWRAQLGYAVGPMCLEEIDLTKRFDAELDPGQFVIFSANHYHGTGLNPGPTSRISVELRLVCEEDRRNGLRSANVDFHGFGEVGGFRELPVL